MRDLEGLLHAERGHGVNVRGATGGYPAGNKGYGDEQHGNEGEGGDVPGLNTVKQAGGKAGGSEGERKANGERDEGEAHASADDHGLDLRGAGSKGHADADLLSAATDGVAHNAVEADCCEQDPGKAKDGE